MKKYARLFLLFSALIVPNCTGPGGEGAGGNGAHTHAGETESHVHADEDPSESVTLWTDDIELFMEYPFLKVGVPAKFLVHLTRLSDFQPVAQGPVLFRFVNDRTPAKMVVADNPNVPGIFGPTVTFEEAGEYTFELTISSDEIETSLQYGPVVVLREDEEPAAPDEDTGQTISYLKEQQWKLPFASEEAVLRDIRETVRVPAEIVPKAGTESIVASNGRPL